MRIPQKFELMGTKWKVQLEDLSEIGKMGRTNFRSQTITIDPNNTKDGLEATYLHEVMHIIVYLMGLDHIMKLDPEAEEILVNTLSNGIFAAIKAKVLNV